jgi:phytoene synthase
MAVNMTMQTFQWEHRLLALAHKAAHAEQALEARTSDEHPYTANQALLEHAYQHCDDITRVHSRTFYLASSLLPAEKQRAIRALYAFCRVSDDLVDRRDPEDDTDLERWRTLSLGSAAASHNPVLLAWSDTRKKFKIPWLYADQLLDGVAKDLSKVRYSTFNELAAYCYGVACTVGLMSMHIIGFSGPEAIPYAIRLGVALQLTNILRDIGEDWRRGRIYLPKEELEAFHLTEEDVARGVIDERWRSFMRAQIARNRQLYRQALPGVALLHPEGRFSIQAAAELYQAILDDIEAHDYEVFQRRASVSTSGKLRRLPGIWIRSGSAPITSNPR